MKFSNEAQRLELIKGFAEMAESLTQTKKAEIPEDTKIIFETVTEWDEKPTIEWIEDPNLLGEKLDSDGEPRKIKVENHGGEIFVCYIRQPQMMTAVILFDKLNKKDTFSAGFTAWDAMVLPFPISSKEIEKHRYKLGLLIKVANALDAAFPDLKKN